MIVAIVYNQFIFLFLRLSQFRASQASRSYIIFPCIILVVIISGPLKWIQTFCRLIDCICLWWLYIFIGVEWKKTSNRRGQFADIKLPSWFTVTNDLSIMLCSHDRMSLLCHQHSAITPSTYTLYLIHTKQKHALTHARWQRHNYHIFNSLIDFPSRDTRLFVTYVRFSNTFHILRDWAINWLRGEVWTGWFATLSSIKRIK